MKAVVAIAIVLAAAAAPSAEPVAVRYLEGLTHGFLSLKTMEGQLIGSGDLIQTVRGDRVTSRLVLHYKDGSTSDETTVYSQRKEFLLLTDHLIQKGRHSNSRSRCTGSFDGRRDGPLHEREG